ncbi:hypothetical protein HLB23_05185 [Nocardia uniformis]|uniref:DUF8020 domain-containing protein n=1 Tax=Nocardia uniformis TaxID=53432 RepID=A0A849C2R0_9NOCA|nr:hypothetical protein [Nocardia uniformis]NNH69269.1 hypothetical protein [Nocardia uniformis]
MKLCATLSVATLAVCAVTAATGTGTADTGSTAADPTVTAAVVGDSVIAVLDQALFTTTSDGRAVDIRTLAGQSVLSLPSEFLLDGLRHPIRYQVMDGGRAVALSPDTGLRPIASAVENQLALDAWADNMSKVPLGTIAGVVLGALVGAVIGLGSCLVVGPACLATAPAAIGAFAGAGGVLGTLIAGGAALADGLWKYVTTVQAEPGESVYAGQGGLLDPNGTGVPDANLRLPNGLGSGSSSGSSSGSGSGGN